MIDEKTAKALDRGGPSVPYTFGKKNLGTKLRKATNGFSAHTHICYELGADDVSGSVATIALDSEYDSVCGILILSNAGEPRAITNVEIVEDTVEEGKFYLKITATSVAATDVVHADLYLTE